MRPHLAPTVCLPFEAEEARSLLWLPLAVRYKLDCCGLRLSLGQWQALPAGTRLELLQMHAGEEFTLRAAQAGAVDDPCQPTPVRLDPEQVARALDCDAATASAWLVAATPFAQYAVGKLRRTAGRAMRSDPATLIG